MANRTRLLMLSLNSQVQLETDCRGDLRHCRPRRLRPGREGGGSHHEGGEEHQVSRQTLLQSPQYLHLISVP